MLTRQARRCFSSSAVLRKTLVLAEHTNAALVDSTLPAITAAAKLGDVEVLVAGKNCKGVAEQVSKLEGVKKVLVAENPAYEHGLAEDLAPLVANFSKKEEYTHILAPASAWGKNLTPRIAGILDITALSDVISIEGQDTFKRPIYAGNAIATVQSGEKLKLLTVRTTAFEKAKEGSSSAEVKEISVEGDANTKSTWVEEMQQKSERPDLTSANIVVSGGRALKSKENFKLIEDLADKLGGAVGASRAAVDAGYAPNEWQVGQTGKVVAPQLYLAVGISGQIQHLAGMKDSKLIVAINNAADAPIFQVSDYGLVQDLFQAVPELTKELEKAKQ
ncbi:electron transfer flavoprotein alphasubunit [Acanthamoeba castellanii str. Neff]|uniref:Electron transfer flavoprotein subunit alpha n=1 Tax=Acanthamoeba castellanii (strain ATCC 30010 / Neff) TaxID=1257118 RepID=L8GI91_ACACF|nr:electron transfer flavoprotein alphasubunit [Acanthamoeba castellanii str. Neff]ELR12564.1 electron transfer flavoprotein alphasubunit [Acanthamoeba castellanii str. Neff]